MTQKEFNDYVNIHPEHFRLENMSENRSHEHEMDGWMDGKDIPKELRDGMQTWINNYRNKGQ